MNTAIKDRQDGQSTAFPYICNKKEKLSIETLGEETLWSTVSNEPLYEPGQFTISIENEMTIGSEQGWLCGEMTYDVYPGQVRGRSVYDPDNDGDEAVLSNYKLYFEISNGEKYAIYLSEKDFPK